MQSQESVLKVVVSDTVAREGLIENGYLSTETGEEERQADI